MSSQGSRIAELKPPSCWPLTSGIAALGDPFKAHTELRGELITLYRERSELLSEETARLTGLSEGLLRASINRGQGLAPVEERFRGYIQGSGVRGGKIDQLFAGLRAETDSDRLESACSQWFAGR